MNARLIRDEGHPNPMTLEELQARMGDWLETRYEAVLIKRRQEKVGYALYLRDGDSVYLRQFYVEPEHRRQGVGRAAVQWLKENSWEDASSIRLDVLVGNQDGIAFWRSLGFLDYCLAMELQVRATKEAVPK